MLPVGAASKEHGPHLKLRNDLTLADYLTARVLDSSAVIVAPTLTYHYYPAFLDTRIDVADAHDCSRHDHRSRAHAVRLRTATLLRSQSGVSTVRALQPAAALLAAEGVLMRYTNLSSHLDRAAKGFSEQEGGTHADEIETSMMLYIDPSSVDMSKAVKDYTPSAGTGLLNRRPGGTGTYSRTGIWGDPTRATREKGRVFVEALVAGILDDIAALRSAALPTPSVAAGSAAEPTRPASAPTPLEPPNGADRCSAGDERAIFALGPAFTTHWNNGDALKLGAMWSTGGNLVHPDGVIERGAQSIAINRAQLFARREYRSTRHPLILAMIRCLSTDIAVADGKWELRGVLDTRGTPLPTMEGQVTLVLKRSREVGSVAGSSDGWLIEAYRYTLKSPAAAPTTPAPLPKRPGGAG